MKKKRSQRERIFDHLAAGYSLTPQQALCKFGCFRLASVIYRLRNNGHFILNHTDNGKYATYKMCPIQLKNRR